MPALAPTTALDPTGPEAQALIAKALPAFQEDLRAAEKALKNGEKSSARWAQTARTTAAINNAALTAAAIITPCSLNRLTDFSCVFNAMAEKSGAFLREKDQQLSARSIGELIALHQAFQGTTPDTQRAVNETMQRPEKIGLSAEVLNESLPDNTPAELATKMAALAIRDIMNRAGVDVSQININRGPGMSMGAGT